MRASKGSFSHDEIMRLTWRQFEHYLDSFRFLLREESKEGQQENKMDDLEAMKEVDGVAEKKKSQVEEIREKLKVHKERAARKKLVQ